MTTMHRLETAEADIAYDVHGPLPAADGRPPLFMIGQPMDASGFGTLASLFPDRTVITSVGRLVGVPQSQMVWPVHCRVANGRGLLPRQVTAPSR